LGWHVPCTGALGLNGVVPIHNWPIQTDIGGPGLQLDTFIEKLARLKHVVVV